jgi:hypothetical protein
VTPDLAPAADIVLAGSPTGMLVRGLPPTQPVTLQAQTPGSADWSDVAGAQASAAGTARFTVAVPTTAAYRVVSGPVASAGTTVTAAVRPSAPLNLVAVPAGKGKVRVTWQPPTDTGGAPLARYVLTVNGVRQVVAPTAGRADVAGVVAGPRSVTLRAANAVATSAAAVTTVDVPAYPTVTARRVVRKRTTVTLSLRGLLPGARATVAVSPRKAGRLSTTRVKASKRGTATVRLVVKRSLRVVVTSDGVRSAPRRIRVR